MATRHPEKVDQQLAQWIEYGVSPRATIGLDRCAKAHAFLKGKDFVSPDDIHAVIHDVFRHRLILSFEAQAQGVTAEKVIDHLIDKIAIV
jgi:MoxR-like ATPase